MIARAAPFGEVSAGSSVVSLGQAPIAILHPNVRGWERKDWGCRENLADRQMSAPGVSGQVARLQVASRLIIPNPVELPQKPFLNVRVRRLCSYAGMAPKEHSSRHGRGL